MKRLFAVQAAYKYPARMVRSRNDPVDAATSRARIGERNNALDDVPTVSGLKLASAGPWPGTLEWTLARIPLLHGA
jgi:hypothetical protein